MFFKLNSKSKCVPCTSLARCSKALNLCGNPMQAFCSRQCQLKLWGQYSKVIFLDVDCLPRLNLVGGLDKMFEFATPKAYMRDHWTREHVPSKVRPAWTHADKYGRQKYGINVRVMVLAPNRQDLAALVRNCISVRSLMSFGRAWPGTGRLPHEAFHLKVGRLACTLKFSVTPAPATSRRTSGSYTCRKDPLG